MRLLKYKVTLWTVSLLTISAVCALLISESVPPSVKTPEARSAVAFLLLDHWQGLELEQAISKGRIHYEDFEKLDFTLPREKLGGNVEYEVFNAKSPRSIWRLDADPFPKTTIQALTEGRSTEVIFNLRRLIEHGVIRERLYIVIPDMSPQACSEINDLRPAPIMDDLNIPDTTHPIITDDVYLEGCVSVQKRLYWFAGMGYRQKKDGSDKWER